MKEVSKKEKRGLYDFVIGLLVITSIAFYDMKWLFLGTQGLALLVVFFRFLLGIEVIEKYWSKYFVWAATFAAYSALSGLWAQEINRTVMSCTVAAIQVFLVGLCVIVYCKEQSKVINIINVFILTAAILCIRFIISVPISSWGQQARFSDETIFGGNSPAMVLAYAAVFLLWKTFAKKETDKKNRGNSIFLICIFMFVSMMMGTKKGLIIFAIGFIVIMMSTVKYPIAIIKRFIWVAVAIALIYYMIMNVQLLYNSIGYRVELMLSGFTGADTDGSTEMRMLFLEEAIRVFKENPIIGIGQDGFRYVNRYEFTYSHNNYLEILANLGTFGLIIYYSLHSSLWRKAVQSKKDNVLPYTLIVIILILDMSVITYSDEIGSMILTILYVLLYSPEKKKLEEIK